MRARFAIILILIAACLGSAAVPAHGQSVPVPWPDKNRPIGLVTNVIGPAGDPASFTLQLGTMSVDLITVPRTRFVAKSLEAQVEKFVSGDYAVVTVRKTKLGLIAVRIAYDVDPFPPLRSLSGMITWVSLDQMHFRLRLDSGKVVPLRIRPQTRYHVDGHPTDLIPTLTRGEAVQVLALQYNGNAIAYEIDLTRPGLTPIRGAR